MQTEDIFKCLESANLKLIPFLRMMTISMTMIFLVMMICSMIDYALRSINLEKTNEITRIMLFPGDDYSVQSALWTPVLFSRTLSSLDRLLPCFFTKLPLDLAKFLWIPFKNRFFIRKLNLSHSWWMVFVGNGWYIWEKVKKYLILLIVCVTIFRQFNTL